MERRIEFDYLRALAMLLGVAFHAALAYSPLVHDLFPTADQQQSPLVDAIIWFSHLFRMPLFFLLAGFGAARLVMQAGVGGLFKNRVQRILVPFVLGMPIINGVMSWLTVRAANTVDHPSPALIWIKQHAEDGPAAYWLMSTGHLWFLYYLLIFTVLTWAFGVSLPKSLADRIQAAPSWAWRWVWPILLVPALAAVSAPHPAPESPLPQFWAVTFFGSFYAVGYFMAARPEIALHVPRHLVRWGVLITVFYLVFLALIEGAHQREAGWVSTALHWLSAWVEACLSVWCTALAVTLGHRFLSVRRPFLDWLARASYWTYLIHLPVLFWIQYWCMDLTWHWLLKLAFSIIGTLAICLLSESLLVHRTVLARFVGGRRQVNSAAVR